MCVLKQVEHFEELLKHRAAMTLNLRVIAWSALAYGIAQAQTATLTSRAGAADGLSATPLSAATSVTSSQPASNTVVINGTSTAFRVLSTLPASVDETQPLYA